ncbi:MAG: dTDP-4-dehydrorhamnose reductase [Gammaproteobacteria bacterium]|nr:dTDP-4-dehydrorhamnose reductase [Gammaproteobacteria bacterium]
MKVLITGAGGQLGHELCARLLQAGHAVIPLTRAEADFTCPERVRDAIAAAKADWVVNCAAYTAVDKAESDSATAFIVNRDAARAVAEAVAGYGGHLLHVSTDFIFDGTQSHPYREDDLANPLGVYAHSKWAGEQAVRELMPEALIVRTAWVHGAQGNNFVKTMLRLAAERDELRVVDDQIGSPSWTGDIADALIALIQQDAHGCFHFTNEGVASWYDFAVAIIAEARVLGFPIKAQRVTPIPTSGYPTPARRPAYSVLDKQKIRAALGRPIPHWREALVSMLRELQT